jgi:hypothetical protein
MTFPRPVLHFALGTTACSVSTHLGHLQGLSGTQGRHDDDDGGPAPQCDVHVTHDLWQEGRNSSLYVPRTLFVDHSFPLEGEPEDCNSNCHAQRSVRPVIQRLNQSAIEKSLWTSSSSTDDVFCSSIENDSFMFQAGPSDPRVPRQDPGNHEYSDTIVPAVRALAYSPHSRYQGTHGNPSRNIQSFRDTSNSRHVDWDAVMETEEQDDDSDEENNQRRRRQRLDQEQLQSAAALQDQLDHYFQQGGERNSSPTSAATQSPNSPWLWHWTQFHRLAPSTPSRTPISVPLGSSNSASSSGMMPGLSSSSGIYDEADFSYSQVSQAGGNFMPDWYENVVWERVRHELERVDDIHGFTLAVSDSSLYAGLATCLLRSLAEESSRAPKWIWSLQDSATMSDSAARPVLGIRHQVERALALKDFHESTAGILPLTLPTDRSTAHAAIRLAVTLETVTLPYRLQSSSSSSLMALHSQYYGHFDGSSNFGTESRLSLSDYLRVLHPRPGQTVLELETILPVRNSTARSPVLSHQSLWNHLQCGTSVERDQRMRLGRDVGIRRPREVLPGGWMMPLSVDVAPTDVALGEGILTSLTPRLDGSYKHGSRSNDRSLHRHIALSTNVRTSIPNQYDARSAEPTLKKYADCLLEGMGVRFRPESSIATISAVDIGTLTGNGYAVGAYLRSALRTTEGLPILSTLSNSTRVYPYLHEIASGMEDALSRQNRGLYNREMMNLPEREDCDEAMIACFDLRDRYTPPQGSGLSMDDDVDVDI